MSSPARRRSACCPGSTTSTRQPNSPTAAAAAMPATPPPATTASKSVPGIVARLEAGESPGRKVGVVEPVIEHGGAEEDAVDPLLRPKPIRLLARDEPVDAAPR